MFLMGHEKEKLSVWNFLLLEVNLIPAAIETTTLRPLKIHQIDAYLQLQTSNTRSSGCQIHHLHVEPSSKEFL